MKRPANGPMIPFRRIARRLRGDRRGTTTITAAVTMPLFIVLLLGFFYLLMLLGIKWQLSKGTQEAAQHLAEISRYWDVSITGTQVTDPFDPGEELTGTQRLPGDMYEREAWRLIGSRLRDLRLYSTDYLTANLLVTVTEPALANGPDSPEVLTGDEFGVTDEGPCSYSLRAEGNQAEQGEFLHHKNIRMLVQSQFNVIWAVRIPFMDERLVTLRDRATSYVRCPRWTGFVRVGETDRAFELGSKGPDLPYRNFMTPSWPTATQAPTATDAPPTAVPSPTP